jgi:predicted metalloprotease
MYWWDGYRWSGDVDCDGDGYADQPVTDYPAGWYGPFEDQCNYWWDGTQYTGEYDCDGDGKTDATEETYRPGWYDLYSDGCLYWFDGSVYTGDVDCNGDGRNDTPQQPDDIDTSSIDDFIDSQVLAINKMWRQRFAAQGLDYSNPRLIIADGPIQIGCLTADGDQELETEDWIFYCSSDQTIYFGPGNLDRIVQAGIGTVQFTVAHEIGHHVQDEMDPQFSTKYASDTVKYENQATCMAGVWFNELDAEGTPSDINAAMTFLSTATDEVHGKGEDQIAALLQGYHDPDSC